MLSSYQSRVDATIAMSRQQEAEARRRDGERVKVVAEEMRRIDERIRIKREMERQKLMEERRAQEEYRRERRRTEQATLNQAITDAWERYETRWDKLKMPDFDEALTFRTIPWPLTYIPKTIEDIHPHAITFFLLSPLHSEEQPRKERIRSALLRWHPDRFRRLLDRVEETDRKAVEEGVGVITRCINDLLMREQSFSAYNL
ncbi:hypothetical protein GLOTRDRAFT_74465 [Gloeophyllum trabeum ATCC 11539]|uniref:Uncharacterized protein n=1 Tax=Gloeophyllum trabeum (strain ATCC 11539 / FP-39264 / Madison 617) TaxID=670483 RepID=S7QCG1_GLOTA|nr:uncharacterized protein GLOTRDRAFT_74465 [Gloeophyllum trabeum ATCC 11539]EPQ57566.1 hypothetical protein GLOTRDRAFT_74465 [Gloeophyllum trabeum ATCC 11539]